MFHPFITNSESEELMSRPAIVTGVFDYVGANWISVNVEDCSHLVVIIGNEAGFWSVLSHFSTAGIGFIEIASIAGMVASHMIGKVFGVFDRRDLVGVIRHQRYSAKLRSLCESRGFDIFIEE